MTTDTQPASVAAKPTIDVGELLAQRGYTHAILKRILNARHKALLCRRRAWYMHRNPRTKGKKYMVLSEHSSEKYYPTVYENRKWGGFCYSLGANPVAWITCTCEAALIHQVPCKHAARVQLRLEREA